MRDLYSGSKKGREKIMVGGKSIEFAMSIKLIYYFPKASPLPPKRKLLISIYINSSWLYYNE